MKFYHFFMNGMIKTLCPAAAQAKRRAAWAADRKKKEKRRAITIMTLRFPKGKKEKEEKEEKRNYEKSDFVRIGNLSPGSFLFTFYLYSGNMERNLKSHEYFMNRGNKRMLPDNTTLPGSIPAC